MNIYLKISLRSWRKHPWTQTFTVFAFGMLLFLSSFFFWAYDSIDPIVARLKEDQVLTVFLNPSLSKENEKEVMDTLEFVMSSAQTQNPQEPKKYELEMVAPEQFMSKLSVQYPELAEELQNIGNDMDTLVPRFVSLSGIVDPERIEKIKAIPHVESLESSLGRYQPILSALQSFQKGLLVFFAGLILSIFTVLFLSNKMNQSLFSETLHLFKLMGAHRYTLKIPAMISSLMSGVLGALFSVLLWGLFSSEWTELLKLVSPFFSRVQPPSLLFIAIYSLGMGMICGVFFGLFQQVQGRKVRE